MDGLSIQRSTPAAPRRPVAAPAGGDAATAPMTYQDALAIIGRMQTPAPAGGSAPPGASAEQLMAELDQRRATATGLEAQRLATFAAVVASTASDPATTAILAQALRQPNASEGAQRLNQLFFNASEATLSQLYYTAAVDDPAIKEQLRAHFPSMIFDKQTGATVLATMMKEIYDPQACLQGDKQTCGATSVQIMLAREGAAEYVRMVTGLAFDYKVTLQNGGEIKRLAGWDTIPGDTRGLTGQLLQPALMDYANGADVYMAGSDDTVSQQDGAARKGLTSPEMTRLLSAVANRQTENSQVKNWDTQLGQWVPKPGETLQYTMAKIEEMTAKGWSIPVLLSVRPDRAFGHYQLITKIEGDTVYTLNPWGQEQPMSKQLFEQRLIASFFQ